MQWWKACIRCSLFQDDRTIRPDIPGESPCTSMLLIDRVEETPRAVISLACIAARLKIACNAHARRCFPCRHGVWPAGQLFNGRFMLVLLRTSIAGYRLSVFPIKIGAALERFACGNRAASGTREPAAVYS